MARGSKSKRNPRNLRTVNSDKKQEEDKPPAWVIDINRRLGEGHTYDAGRSWTIYRVPSNLREVHKSAFVPKIISIGPFHFGDPRLQAMEEHKMRCLVRLLGGKFEEDGGRGPDQEEMPRKTINLENLVKSMKLVQQKTRACYSEFFDIPSDDFVQMMVIDGCFVVEILRHFYKFDKQEIIADPILETRWMLRTLQRDLLMLENQLPFFVLEEIFKLTSTDQEEPSLPVLTVTFFNPLLPREDVAAKLDKEEEYDHLLDVFRATFLSAVRARVKSHGWSSHNLSMPASQDVQLIHCAVELTEAGLKIRKRENCDLLDISYSDRVLKIPPLYIDDNTVPMFFNFVAFEQCDKEAKPFFTNFFIFLDSLIYSKLDIQILHREGIINHVLGSDKGVAILINTLGRQIVYDPGQNYLSVEMKEVNHRCKVYYESRLQNWWRNLVKNYFNNPWSLVSLIAAISLLILTFLQTFYTMYPYYEQE
ncbi:UPF0481 protein At3g47200-like [Punica granatum]|uniref:Uncharacterized protein n=2 Tax=Punica granatum TaxID=22663 RepID=A0A218X9M9_PUNGR|nr:UPF0481 protein At3g47200-like [Punica granatum]OWM81468.1 hypothetical protein CDL15_Pgr007506 [Punica granatum]PKI60078.1 hypothetical protein CRG98_019563 [Punica granatum]